MGKNKTKTDNLEEEKIENNQTNIETEQHEKVEEVANEEKNTQDTDTQNQKEETTENKEQEYLLIAQKIQAEFENYKKRTLKAESEARTNGIIEAVSKFLPVIDSFNIAQKQEQNAEYIKTNAIIINQLEKALSDLGVEKIPALSKQFDYNLHNAIMVENNSDYADNEIVEVYSEGYKLKDKVIRHSVVKINQK